MRATSFYLFEGRLGEPTNSQEGGKKSCSECPNGSGEADLLEISGSLPSVCACASV